MAMFRMTVGEAAAAVGVSSKALRLWESKGLIPDVERNPTGYRVFRESDLVLLRFIRQAQALGMTLGEIKTILELRRAGNVPCGRVTQMLDDRIGKIDQTLADLQQLRHTLLTARLHAEAGTGEGVNQATMCPIIEHRNK